MRLRTFIAAGALSMALAAPALADITVLEGNAPGALDPVLLDAGLLDFVVNGVTGPNNTEVTFTGSENLTVQGQSITAETGTFNFLLFTLTDPGSAFTAAEFNLTAAASGPISIFAYDQFGDGFGGVFALSEIGSNWFNVVATNDQIIRSIVLMSTAPLTDVGSVRLGGITATLVPEPATWAIMIAGFGGVGASLRARRRLAAA
jgi:hypothetical protein